jgi:hypothetical protein
MAARLGQQENTPQDAQKGGPARPQRAKKRRSTLRYVEPLSEARTPLGERASQRAGVGRVKKSDFSHPASGVCRESRIHENCWAHPGGDVR